jgi:hypothetical protein
MRLTLHGVLVEASPAGVRLAATDGHALLVARAAADTDTDTWTGIIPVDVVKAALAWKGNKSLPIILIPGEPECRLTRATGEALVFVPVAGRSRTIGRWCRRRRTVYIPITILTCWSVQAGGGGLRF